MGDPSAIPVYPGPKGDTGATGPTGTIGPTGAEGPTGPVGEVEYQFYGDQLDSPASADWAVNVNAGVAVDSNNAAIPVRRFNDTTEEGVGLLIEIPTGVTNIIVALRSRAETGAAANLDVVPKLYVREMPDNAVVESWSAGTDMTTITMGTSNEYWQYDEQTIALTTLGLVAGRIAQIELTRDAADGNDTLVGDWTLLAVVIGFS